MGSAARMPPVSGRQPSRAWKPIAVSLLVVLACTPPVSAPQPELRLPDAPAPFEGVAAGDLFAEQVTAASAARRLVGGPHAVGGVGDWALGNGVLCAVVSAPEHPGMLTRGGGLLVDLGHCGRADDQLAVLHLHMLNLSRQRIAPVHEIEAAATSGEARVVTRGSLQGVAFETVYRLDRQFPQVLRVTSRFVQGPEGERLFLLGDVALHGRRSLAPFALSTRSPAVSVGFRHPGADPERLRSIIAAIRPLDLHVLVGSDDVGPGISYGLLVEEASLIDSDGTRRALSIFGLNGPDYTLLGVFTRPLWLGGRERIGWLQFLQTPFMRLRPGETLEIRRAIIVGERADVASVSDRFFPDAALVRGRVADPRARIHVDRDARLLPPAPFTLVRPDTEGRFRFRAPSGRYALRVHSPGRPHVEQSFEVGEQDLELGELDAREPATLLLPRGATMRLVFLGLGDTPDPSLGDDLLGFASGGVSHKNSAASRSAMLAGTPADPTALTLAPGRYRVLATRGPEDQQSEARIALRAGATHVLEIAEPPRAFATPGWIAADLHVHSGRSFDSTLPISAQVRAFAAQGGEVLVSTEHDFVADYAPVIRALGLETRLASVVGSEATGTAITERLPYTAGHHNAFPLSVRPLAHARGALREEGRRLRELVAQVHAIAPGALLQLNHPRPLESGAGESLQAYLTHLAVAGSAYRPDRPLDREPNRALLEPDPETGLRDLDFDLIELMNGPSHLHYRLARADWLSLLLQGAVRTGTANSDSHEASAPVALPRNYVRVEDESIPRFDEAAFVAALRAGRVVGTTGPWIEAALDGALPGDTATGRSGTLRVAVRAADWVPVSALRVRVNGVLVHESAIRPGSDHALPLRFREDALVTVEVEGEATPLFDAILPGGRPLAFTNPIFVDADADGTWRAPGLPHPLPRVLTHPADTP